MAPVGRRLGQRELLQRTQSPGRQPVPFRQVGGRRNSAAASDAVARRPSTSSASHSTSGRSAAAATAAARAAGRRRAGRGPGRRGRRRRPAAARASPGSAHARARVDVGRRGLRVAGGEGGPDEDEQEADSPCGRRAQLVEPVQQLVPERPGRAGLSGVGEDGHQHLLGLRGGRGPGRGQRPRAFGRQLGAGQCSTGQGAPGALGRERRGRVPVAGALGELGRQLAPRAGQARVCPLHRHERPARQLGALRWQQLGEHGLPGERVAEPEPLAVDGDELGVDGPTQRPDGRRAVDRGDAGEQVPVETPAQHGRGGEHLPGVRVERLRAGCAATRRSWRAPTGWAAARPATARPPGPAAPEVTSPASSSSIRNGSPSLCSATKAGTARSTSAPDRQARTMSAHSRVGQGSEGEDRADPPALQPVEHVRDGRRPDRPGGGQAEHPLGGEGVGEVVDHRQRLRVRPVQVLEHEQAPGGTAEHPEQPDHRLADEHGGVVGAAGRVRCAAPVRHEPGELAAEPGQLGRVRGPLAAARHQQRLAQRPERERGPRRVPRGPTARGGRGRPRAPPPPAPAATCRRRPRPPARRARPDRPASVGDEPGQGSPARPSGRRPPGTGHRPSVAVSRTSEGDDRRITRSVDGRVRPGCQ